ncbi:hypothetical protein ACOMHN_053170 [Nucella lapillus]
MWCRPILSISKDVALCYAVGVYFTKCVDNVVFTENIEFKTEAVSAIDCSRHCVVRASCVAFTFSQPLCQGHSQVMTSSSEQTTVPGATFFVKHGAGTVRCREPNGVQVLSVPSYGSLTVSCHDGWIVFLRRKDGSEDFYRDWKSYVKGFGNVSGEFWMGLEALYQITNSASSSGGSYYLSVDLRDWNDTHGSALYTNFSLGPAHLYYPLNVSYSHGSANDSLSNSNGLPFTTKDADRDKSTKKNCAVKHHGAFWYLRCTAVNLMGRYYNTSTAPNKDGLTWKTWRGTAYSLKFAQLKIRPQDSC